MEERKMMRKVVFCGLISCLLLGGNIPGLSANAVAGDEESMPKLIWLKAEIFDPLTKDPGTAEMIPDYEDKFVGLLQFDEHPSLEMIRSLSALGVVTYDYIPMDTYIVRVPADIWKNIKKMGGVRWLGPYLPEYKIDGELMGIHNDFGMGEIPVSVHLFHLSTQAVIEISELSEVVYWEKDTVHVSLDKSNLESIARMPQVKWIDLIPSYRPTNDVSVTILNVDDVWNAPYQLTGQSQIIAVADTGLDTGVDTGLPGSIHRDFLGRVTIDSFPVQAGYWCVINAGIDDGGADTGTGHGTHVAGSAVGDGTVSQTFPPNDVRGAAFDADLYFQAVEQWTDMDDSDPACPADGLYLTGIPLDKRNLLTPAYNAGARIHSNSWGSASNFGEYTNDAQELDDFVRDNRDLVVVFSAGNEGEDGDSDGEVDMVSVTPPATAKNIITVGASENLRNRFAMTYNAFVCDWGPPIVRCFPVDPINSDTLDENAEGMAAFSSRGWTFMPDDGRVKPDLVAPGTWILSTMSSVKTIPMWGPASAGGYDPNMDPFYEFAGGTSMAAPMVAGSAALVREWYADNGLANPSAALVKATLINGAVDMTGQYGGLNGAAEPIPNPHEGWGRIDLMGSVGDQRDRMYWDEDTELSTGQSGVHTIYVNDASMPLRVTLAWTDAPGSLVAFPSMVNDMDLTVRHVASDTCYYGNAFFQTRTGSSTGWAIPRNCALGPDPNNILTAFDQVPIGGDGLDDRNNVENVYIPGPATGFYEITTHGMFIDTSFPQNYALLVSGLLDLPPAPPTNLYSELSSPSPTDVVLTWIPSADDGGGENDVVSYDIYYSTTLGGTYTILGTVPWGIATYTHVGAALPIDTNDYFYAVVANDAVNTGYDKNERAGKFYRDLTMLPPKVLISLPLIPKDSSTPVVLGYLLGDYCVEWYNSLDPGDPWKQYCTYKPYNDLPTLDPEMGLWLFDHIPQPLVLTGKVPPIYDVPLAIGWNHVGYPTYLVYQFMDNALIDQDPDVCYDRIEMYDPNSPPYYLILADPFGDQFFPGEGYWIRVTSIGGPTCASSWKLHNQMEPIT